jgi:hypothetical protein
MMPDYCTPMNEAERLLCDCVLRFIRGGVGTRSQTREYRLTVLDMLGYPMSYERHVFSGEALPAKEYRRWKSNETEATRGRGATK